MSQHLAALKLVGLVTNRREGRTTHYSANPRGLKPLTNWLEIYSDFWTDRFDKLEQFLKDIDQ